MFDLTGKVALVTGAGRGVGAGITDAFARQGAVVVVNDIDAERAAATASRVVASGGRAHVVAFDVTDHAAVVAGFAEAAHAAGPVDVLVNNAGIPTSGVPQMPFVDTDPGLWRRFVDLNLYGVLHCTHAALPSMCERGWGRVITISSEAGRSGTDLGIAVYGAAKAGAVGLMRHVAREVGPSGVTVNTLSLGVMGPIQGPIGERFARSVPRRRIGDPADVGAAAVFLASDEAEWITGQVLPVNGGALTN
jgi:NAD(P)-dependent dehydrogenase (short-subunit alcohol dehydrogenase family)